MINIKFSMNEKTGVISLKVKGHAGQSETGKDIVCASVSILAYTVARVVTNIHNREGFEESPTVKLLKGNAVITCHPKEDFRDEVLHTYFVSQVGYDLLAYNYPQYVELTKFGEV